VTQETLFALYTTVYPGVEKYLPVWYDSVLAQTDRHFDLWVGVDGLAIDIVVAAMGAEPSATWVLADEGDSPAQIRQRAIARMVDVYPAVVFVDSDDLLDPTRVAAARESLEQHDVSACAMRLIDEDGDDLGLFFGPPEGTDVAAVLPRYNVFGLSNTVYRSAFLRRCLPIPTDCVLVDWYLATRAWALGARLGFDATCRMAYRQHGRNIAPVLPPFTLQQVVAATERVLNHYGVILEQVRELQPQRRSQLEAAHGRVKAFWEATQHSYDIMHRYVQALNQLAPEPVWWACVAHPRLEEIWKR
jgi:hypothetical protein